MSGGMQAIPGAGGYNPRNTGGNIVISHVTTLASPDKSIQFYLDGDFKWGMARKVEGFTVTDLLSIAQWAGQRYVFGDNAGGQFECFLAVNSGPVPNLAGGSAVSTWLTLGTGQFWGYERTTVGISTGSWTISIRSKFSTQVIALLGISPTLQVL